LIINTEICVVFLLSRLFLLKIIFAVNYLNNLNTNQREAVEYISGPSLIIAGAGSGKTRVLTYKIAYLLSVGYSPTSLLALTFTNKAANEMKERIASLVGYEKAKGLWMGTFHSVFSKILRFEAEKIDYTQKFYNLRCH
jgi:DNA helicase-2/ATP-dependent DNA helicase PcrA